MQQLTSERNTKFNSPASFQVFLVDFFSITCLLVDLFIVLFANEDIFHSLKCVPWHMHTPAMLAEVQHMKMLDNVSPWTASSKSVAICWKNINCCGRGPASAW